VLQARPHPQQGYRTALGILRLAKAYGNDRLEAACQRAARLQVISYRSLASILKHGLDRQSPTPTQAPLPPHHANVRGPAYYH
jgi:transposase